jgi:SAM-dependent methyltransferase
LTDTGAAAAGAAGAATFRVPAEAYDRHIGRYSRALAGELIAAAGVRAGARVLDVGCGPGGLTGELVALLGAGQVAAVDPSPSFLEACRLRHPAVQVELAPAESLPFADASFDHALAQLVVNFMRDPLAGVREMRRVTRAGGTVAAAVWDYAGGMTLLRRFWDAAVALDPAAAVHDEGQSMGVATPPRLHELWSSAGLGSVDVMGVVVSAAYDDFDDLWRGLEGGVGPAGAWTTSRAPDARLALKDELRRRLGIGDEPFELTARAWIVAGTVA